MNESRWQRLEGLFDQALRLEPAKRRSFLEGACRDDPELVVEVESLLTHAQPSPRLEAALGLAAAHVLAAQEQETAGGKLGPYTLIEKLGQGGMGSVWLAEQTSPLRRRVAIKRLLAGSADPAAIRRIEAEAQALAELSHPAIAQIYDLGTDTEGQPFLVMEWVRGETLLAYCEQRRLGLEERLDLLHTICLAVQHAHDRGVLHRDLKPSNLLVAEEHGRPLPKVIDFGVAKVLARPESQALAAGPLTGPVVLGTPAYMSPEALSPAAAQGGLDPRSDVYSLGVVLEELAKGAAHVIPEGLRQIVAQATARDRDQRTPSAGALAAELGRWLEGDRGSLPIGSRPSAARRAFFTALVLLSAVAVGALLLRSPADRTGLAPATISDPLAREHYLKGRYFWNQRSRESLEKAVGAYRQALAIEPDNARIYAALADTYVLLVPYGGRTPEEAYPLAKEAALAALARDPTLAEAHAVLALVLHEHELDWPGAEASYRRALAADPAYVTAHQWYAELLSRAGRHGEAIAAIERARQLEPLSLIVNAVAGWVWIHAGRYEEAITQLNATLELDPRFVPALGFLGLAELGKGRPEAALPHLRRALELSGGNPRYLAELGVAETRAGDRAAAEATLSRLGEISHPVPVHGFHRARLLLALGRREEALTALEEGQRQGGVWMLLLKTDPLLVPLRGEPRFKRLLEALRFPS